MDNNNRYRQRAQQYATLNSTQWELPKSNKRPETNAAEAAKELRELPKSSKRPDINAAEAAKELRELPYFSLRTFLSTIKRNKYGFISFFLVCCLVLSLGFYISEQLSASTVMSLNYEDSAKGRNPNGTRFNVSDLRSDGIIVAAIDSAGLSGIIDAQELADCLSITPSVQRSAGDGSYYISTSYQVALTMPYQYGHLISTQDMLGLICRTFKQNFYEQHMITARALPEKLEPYEDMEYSQIGDYISLIATRAQSYLDMRLTSAGSFTAQNGETFTSLKQHLNNFVSYDLAIYNALIWERGVARDRAQEISMLTTLNHSLTLRYQQYIMESEMYQKIVNEYDNSMTASMLIPTYDQDQEYYMARTKTGVDDLSKAAFDKQALAATVQSRIGLNENRIAKLEGTTDQSWYERADSLAAALYERLETVLSQIRTMDSEYIDFSTRNAVTFTKNEPSLTDMLHAKDVLVISLFGCVLLYFVYVRRERHRLKKMVERFGANRQPAREG